MGTSRKNDGNFENNIENGNIEKVVNNLKVEYLNTGCWELTKYLKTGCWELNKYLITGSWEPVKVRLGYVTLRYVTLRYVTLRYVTLG